MSAMKNNSLYIPHVFPNFDKEYVAKVFKNIGEVSHIDFVAKQDHNGNDFNAVYVHFTKWYTNKKAIAFYESVIDETKEARLIHDEPWYWIVLPNTSKKHVPGQRKPKLDLGDSKPLYCARLTATPVKEATVKPIEKPVIEEVKWLPDVSFDEVAAFEAEIDAEMDEIEEFLEEEDANLIRIDGRYVQQLESENWTMNMEIIQLRAALINLHQMYQAEVAKVRAFDSTSVDL